MLVFIVAATYTWCAAYTLGLLLHRQRPGAVLVIGAAAVAGTLSVLDYQPEVRRLLFLGWSLLGLAVTVLVPLALLALYRRGVRA